MEKEKEEEEEKKKSLVQGDCGWPGWTRQKNNAEGTPFDWETVGRKTSTQAQPSISSNPELLQLLPK